MTTADSVPVTPGILAFFVGFGVTAGLGIYVSAHNRQKEHGPNVNTPPPTRGELAWHLVHVRDDVAMLFAAVAVTNGLLAAMLAVLLFRAH